MFKFKSGNKKKVAPKEKVDEWLKKPDNRTTEEKDIYWKKYVSEASPYQQNEFKPLQQSQAPQPNIRYNEKTRIRPVSSEEYNRFKVKTHVPQKGPIPQYPDYARWPEDKQQRQLSSKVAVDRFEKARADSPIKLRQTQTEQRLREQQQQQQQRGGSGGGGSSPEPPFESTTTTAGGGGAVSQALSHHTTTTTGGTLTLGSPERGFHLSQQEERAIVAIQQALFRATAAYLSVDEEEALLDQLASPLSKSRHKSGSAVAPDTDKTQAKPKPLKQKPVALKTVVLPPAKKPEVGEHYVSLQERDLSPPPHKVFKSNLPPRDDGEFFDDTNAYNADNKNNNSYDGTTATTGHDGEGGGGSLFPPSPGGRKSGSAPRKRSVFSSAWSPNTMNNSWLTANQPDKARHSPTGHTAVHIHKTGSRSSLRCGSWEEDGMNNTIGSGSVKDNSNNNNNNNNGSNNKNKRSTRKTSEEGGTAEGSLVLSSGGSYISAAGSSGRAASPAEPDGARKSMSAAPAVLPTTTTTTTSSTTTPVITYPSKNEPIEHEEQQQQQQQRQQQQQQGGGGGGEGEEEKDSYANDTDFVIDEEDDDNYEDDADFLEAVATAKVITDKPSSLEFDEESNKHGRGGGMVVGTKASSRSSSPRSTSTGSPRARGIISSPPAGSKGSYSSPRSGSNAVNTTTSGGGGAPPPSGSPKQQACSMARPPSASHSRPQSASVTRPQSAASTRRREGSGVSVGGGAGAGAGAGMLIGGGSSFGSSSGGGGLRGDMEAAINEMAAENDNNGAGGASMHKGPGTGTGMGLGLCMYTTGMGASLPPTLRMVEENGSLVSNQEVASMLAADDATYLHEEDGGVGGGGGGGFTAAEDSSMATLTSSKALAAAASASAAPTPNTGDIAAGNNIPLLSIHSPRVEYIPASAAVSSSTDDPATAAATTTTTTLSTTRVNKSKNSSPTNKASSSSSSTGCANLSPRSNNAKGSSASKANTSSATATATAITKTATATNVSSSKPNSRSSSPRVATLSPRVAVTAVSPRGAAAAAAASTAAAVGGSKVSPRSMVNNNRAIKATTTGTATTNASSKNNNNNNNNNNSKNSNNKNKSPRTATVSPRTAAVIPIIPTSSEMPSKTIATSTLSPRAANPSQSPSGGKTASSTGAAATAVAVAATLSASEEAVVDSISAIEINAKNNDDDNNNSNNTNITNGGTGDTQVKDDPAAVRPFNPMMAKPGMGGPPVNFLDALKAKKSKLKKVETETEKKDSPGKGSTQFNIAATGAIQSVISTATDRAIKASIENAQRKAAWNAFLELSRTDIQMELSNIGGNFMINELLGRGKFASVYSAKWRQDSNNMNNNNNNNNKNNSPPMMDVAIKIAQFYGSENFLSFKPAVDAASRGISGSNNNNNNNNNNSRTLCSSAEGKMVMISKALPTGSDVEGTEDAPWKRPPLSCITEFTRELQCLKELKGHNRLVQLQGYVMRPFSIVLGLCSGGDLYGSIRSMQWQRVTSINERLSLMRDVSDGLAFIHSKGYLHRDIKAHNILLDAVVSNGHYEDGGTKLVAKIADFGAAVKLTKDAGGSPGSYCTEPMGTSGYTAPEIFTKGQYSFPADVFSFAVVCWELLPHFQFSETETECSTATIHSSLRALLQYMPPQYCIRLPDHHPLVGLDPYDASEKIENGIRPPITCLPTKDVATATATATAGTTESSNTFEALSRAVELTTACWKSEPSQRLPMHVADKLLKEIITSYN